MSGWPDPGPKYRVPLNVEIPNGGRMEHVPRTVVFRLGRSGRSISYATAGYVEGTLQLDGRKVAIRRVDANGDGGMADPLDLLWVNWKNNEDWNPFIDRLPADADSLAGEPALRGSLRLGRWAAFAREAGGLGRTAIVACRRERAKAIFSRSI